MTPTLERLEKKNLMTTIAVDVVITPNTDGSEGLSMQTTAEIDDGSTNVSYSFTADPANPSGTSVSQGTDPATGEATVSVVLQKLPPLPGNPAPPPPTSPRKGVIYKPNPILAPPYLIYIQDLPPGFVGPPCWYQVPIGGPVTPVAPGAPGPLPNPLPLQTLPPLPGGPATTTTPGTAQNNPVPEEIDFDLFYDESGNLNYYENYLPSPQSGS